MKKFKMLGLALAVMMILAVAVMPSLADEPVEDVTIISSLERAADSTMEYANGRVDGVSAPLTVEKVYDTALNDTVKSYSRDSFPATTSVGNEPRHFLIPKNSSNVALGGIDYKTAGYNYVRLETDVYIGNATDGIALRINRYEADDTLPKYDYYIGIGGSSFTAGTVTTGESHICKDLQVGVWQRVVIEIGVSTNREVKFFIDNVLKKKEDLKANTYGIAGASENRCAFVLKGQKNLPFEVKLHDFSVKASASALAYEQTSETVYALANNATLTRASNNSITVETVQAPDINSAKFGKDVIHFSSDAYATGVSNWAGAGQLPIYSMVSTTNAKLGNVDYSQYNYLRAKFNVYINDNHSGVILRLSRYNSDNTISTRDYMFGIGGSEFVNISYNATSAEPYTYKGLTTGKWHTVVVELGVQSGDDTMNIYVDGVAEAFEDVDPDKISFGDENSGTGYCGRSANRCGIIPKSYQNQILDMYLSDVLLTVENSAYDPANAGFPNFDGSFNEYTEYLGEGKAIAYNKKYATFKYNEEMDDPSSSDYVTINSADYSGDTTNVNIDFVNSDGDKNAATVVVAYYKETESTPKLVMAKFINVNTENLFTNLSNNIDKPNAEFDYVKVFAIDGTNVKPLGTVTFGTGAVEVLPEE